MRNNDLKKTYKYNIYKMSEQTTTNIPEELTQQQAIGLLIQGVEMAQDAIGSGLAKAKINDLATFTQVQKDG